MTDLKSPLNTLLYCFIGSLLLILVPQWIILILILNIIAAALVQLAYKHRESLKMVKNFCFEFFGFCFLVSCFIGTTTLMYGLLFA